MSSSYVCCKHVYTRDNAIDTRVVNSNVRLTPVRNIQVDTQLTLYYVVACAARISFMYSSIVQVDF